MLKIKKMRYLIILIITLSILVGQKSNQSNPISENQIGMASGIFANYGTAGMEVDGYFEVQTKSGLFLESSGIAQLGEQMTLNTSLGIMNEVAPDILMGGGYSNYLEINNEVLHEAFIGLSSNLISGVAFIGLGSELSPNYLTTLNLNSIFPNLIFDYSVMLIMSKDIDFWSNEFGYDIFFNISKTYGSGLSFGYTISSERYEDEETITYNKQGYSKTFKIPVTAQGTFISLFIGWTF